MLDCYYYDPVQQDTVQAGLLLLCSCPTGYSTRWIVTTMSLSYASATQRHIFPYASVRPSKMYKGQVLLAPKY